MNDDLGADLAALPVAEQAPKGTGSRREP